MFTTISPRIPKLVHQFLRLTHFNNNNKVIRMNEAYFKHLVSEKKVHITFRLVNESLKCDRIFNFVRDETENVDTALNRIKSNLEKEFNKKNKKKVKKVVTEDTAKPETIEISVELFDKEGRVENKEFTSILSELEDVNNDFSLKLLDDKYKILYNWPWVNAISLPKSLLAGFYVYPSKIDFEFADKKQSEFIWYRGMMPASGKEEEIKWQEIARGFAFLIRQEDVGFKLKVKAIPKLGDKVGPTVEAIAKNEMQAGPGICPFETRHLFTQNQLSGKNLRIASYNILADYYADSDYTRAVLFPYCPAYALAIDYRKQLFMKEILGYNADILCMQEVDAKVFEQDLEPFLGDQNMLGVHQKKGTTPEGLATFYKTDRFELIEKFGINIGDKVKTLPAFKELWLKIQSNEKLVPRVVDRSTTLQLVILKSKEFVNRFLIVANTHLYFHPDADHVRLLQIGFSMLFVEDTFKKFKEANPTADVGLIFAGDFNSVPECGIYKLMTEKFVGEDFIDWNSNAEQAVKNVTLSQPFNMKSACGTPQFTNFTAGFTECIDYIWFQTDSFKANGFVEMPSNEELRAHTAIPSVVFPSDHLALVAELEWLK